MSKFKNRGAVINSPLALTDGMPCVIERYDQKAKKYKVNFDGIWCGWYKLKELRIDGHA